MNAIAPARENPDTLFTVWDLPGAAENARRKIAECGLTEQISVVAGDIFTDPYPYPGEHDCALFANQMVI